MAAAALAGRSGELEGLAQPVLHAHGLEQLLCRLPGRVIRLTVGIRGSGKCQAQLAARGQWAHRACLCDLQRQSIGRCHACRRHPFGTLDLGLCEARPGFVTAFTLAAGRFESPRGSSRGIRPAGIVRIGLRQPDERIPGALRVVVQIVGVCRAFE